MIENSAATLKAATVAANKLGIKPHKLKMLSQTHKLNIIKAAMALQRLNGNNDEWTRHFMSAANKHFNSPPIELVLTEEGSDKIVQYLEALLQRT